MNGESSRQIQIKGEINDAFQVLQGTWQDPRSYPKGRQFFNVWTITYHKVDGELINNLRGRLTNNNDDFTAGLPHRLLTFIHHAVILKKLWCFVQTAFHLIKNVDHGCSNTLCSNTLMILQKVFPLFSRFCIYGAIKHPISNLQILDLQNFRIWKSFIQWRVASKYYQTAKFRTLDPINGFWGPGWEVSH